MKKRLLLLFIIPLMTFGVQAQERLVSGRVIGEDGNPLPGVNVLLKGTTNGTVTDSDGKYKLSVPAKGAVLTFSFIGMASEETEIGERAIVDVGLKTDVKQLSEVVITSLGLKEDRDKFASSVSTVQGGNVARSGEPGLLQGLSGKASGVLITRNGGDPGAGAYIQIRGQNTLLGNAQPLFIVDGIPVSNTSDNLSATAATGGTNSIQQQSRINDINPEDIASVEVLKGASAAALWGTRAANGVIIITTKRGSDTKGKVDISFKSTVSFDEVNKMHPLQTTYGNGSNGMYTMGSKYSWGDQISTRSGGADTFITNPSDPGYNGYVTFPDGTKRYAIASGDAINPHGGKNSQQVFDHTKDAFGKGWFADNNISISGGNSRTNFAVSYGNLDQQGVIKNFSDYKRNTARVNVSSQFTEWFKAAASVGYTNSTSSRVNQGDNVDGLMLGQLRTAPDFNNAYYTGTYTDVSGINYANRHVSYRNPLGAGQSPLYSNPIWNINNNKSTSAVSRFMGNLELTLDPTSWLKILGRAGVDTYIDNQTTRYPEYSANYPSGGFLSRYTNQETQFNVDAFARASKRISDKFNFSVLVGTNYNSRSQHQDYGQITNLIVATAPDFLQNALNSNLIATNNAFLIRTYAYYAQIEAEALDMFNLNLTGRDESASTFGSKAGNSFFFPSGALAWRFTNLEALKGKSLLSFGKLRVNWGQVGIQPNPYVNFTNFSPAAYYDSYASSLQSASSLYLGGYARSSSAGNDYLKPERKTEFEVGTDLRFFNDRITLGVTYFNNNTKDVILQTSIPNETGYSNQYSNAAKLGNKGLEVEVGGDVLRTGDFSWNTSPNFSFYRSKVLSLGGNGVQSVPGGGYAGNSLIEGQPYGVFYGTDFQRGPNGKYLLDPNGFPLGGIQNQVVGDPNPKWRGGWGNRFNYKNLSLYVLFDVVYGNQFYNGTRGALYFIGTHKDVGNTSSSSTPLKAYDGSTINPETKFQGNIYDFGGGPVALNQAWYQGPGTSFNGYSEKQFVENATATRLREVTLTYSLRGDGFKSRTKLKSVDFSITGRNLILWTPYTGTDPEINVNQVVTARGQDWFNNPNTRSYLFSIKINY